MQKVLKFAKIYSSAAILERPNNIHEWAARIVNEAFRREMGRNPTPAERQIVMAVSNLESSYGIGWKGQGKGSHNWGAIQSQNKNEPQFNYQDSSPQGSYVAGYKQYPDDISGASDVIKILFKSNRKQQRPEPNKSYRAIGGPISGPGRGELIQEAAASGDTMAFSRAMWYTTYFEGTAHDFTDRIKQHAAGIQKRVNEIANALGETPAWNILTDHSLPVTNDNSVISEITKLDPSSSGSSRSITNTQEPTPAFDMPDLTGIADVEKLIWFE